MLGQAVIFHGPGQPLMPISSEIPPLHPGEMLVRVRCCTLCGSDLHTYTGRRTVPVPTVLGHEILGDIVDLGAASDSSWRLGERITWTVTACCGQCFYCRERLPQKCEHLFKYGHESIQDRHPFMGGLAEYCILAPGTTMVRVPADLPDAVACPANCATATVAAALRTAGGVQGRNVLIQGAGVLGLTACALARHLGAAEVFCSDVDSGRLQRASDFGAAHLLEAHNPELAQTIKAQTAGRGVDVAVELSGTPDAVAAGFDLIRIGGCYILVGSVFPTPSVPLFPEQVVRRMLTIRGVHNYMAQDLQTAVDFLQATRQQYPWESLIGGEFSLTQAEEAFRAALAQPGRRVLVRPATA